MQAHPFGTGHIDDAFRLSRDAEDPPVLEGLNGFIRRLTGAPKGQENKEGKKNVS
jgi:hypothetical protein